MARAVLAVAVAIAAAGCLDLLLGTESTPAPAFALRTVFGANVTEDTYAGRVLVLDFMATTCEPCKDVAAHLATARANEDVHVLSISIAGDPAEEAALAAWAAEEGRGWDHAVDTDGVFYRYGGTIIPYLVFVDSDGVIRERVRGDVTYPTIQSAIRATRGASA